jgi:hypothetical protein
MPVAKLWDGTQWVVAIVGAKGDTGDVGAGLPPTSPADEGKTIFVTSTGSTELRIPSTTDVTEGTNLYYTDQRVEDVIATLDTDSLSEGQNNLYYTNNRVYAPLFFLMGA